MKHFIAASWGSLLAAAVILGWDVILTGFYCFSAILCPVWFVASVVKALVQRPRLPIAIGRMLFPLATLLLSVDNYLLQDYIATARAERIIQACEDYRAAKGNYPDQLDQLVPAYLPAIPWAKYCCCNAHFDYCVEKVADRRYHSLYWHPYPAFLRKSYGLESRRWHVLD